MTTQFRVADASCGHCKQTIESAVLSLSSVISAKLDLDTKRLTIEHGEGVGRDQLTLAIKEAGYAPEPVA